MESLLEHTDVVRRKGRHWRKIMNLILLAVFLGFIIWGAIRYYYPYAEGVKSGRLNQIVYKGFIFKTYEGKLIRTTTPSPEQEGLRSNEFIFSVAKKDIAEKLMHAGGKAVELHYIEYFGAIPWRGESQYVVDAILSISEEKEPLDTDDAVVHVMPASVPE